MNDFLDAVGRLASGSHYVVEPTERGFDVRLDLADARWYELYSRAGLKTTFTHHVRIRPEDRSFRIIDDFQELSWAAGADGRLVPRLGGKAQRVLGTTLTFEKKKIFAVNDQGRYAPVVDYTFNSAEGRALIKEAARQTGYRQRLDPYTRLGIVFGIIGASSVILVPLGLLLKAVFHW